MKSFVLLLLFCPCILLLFARAGCNKKCFCFPARIYLNYINFSLSETDTIVIRRYKKGSNFTQLNDTNILSTNNSAYYPHTDTMHIRTDVETLILRSTFDYELYLPAGNKLSRISDIAEEQQEVNCRSRNLSDCINRIIFFRLDGQSAPVDPVYPNVYIRR